MNPFLPALPVLVIALMAANFLRERSFKFLDVSQAGSLVLNFRPNRQRSFGFVVAVLGVFFVLRFSVPSYTRLWFLLFIGVMWSGYLVLNWMGWKKLSSSGFPREFLRLYGFSMLVGMTGFSALFAAMVATQFMDFASH